MRRVYWKRAEWWHRALVSETFTSLSVTGRPRDVKIRLLGPGWAEATAADFAFLSQSGDGCKAGVSNADSWERTMHALKFF
jgi:hypothetical protein